ncbi:MAG: ABC transporter permease [Saprospirales bacterium]|nr:ABC transporter permease [Saprospirales bacterium]
MKTILFIIQKEFLTIFRTKGMLPILFVMPFVQMIILPFAADYEIKNIKLTIVDNDRSALSRQLNSHFQASPFFEVLYANTQEEAESRVQSNQSDLYLVIPPRFEYRLLKERNAPLHLTIDAINGAKAGVAQAYVQSIILGFNREVIAEWGPQLQGQALAALGAPIDVSYQNWFNPDLDYNTFMVPGILVLLVTLIGGILAGINIVREKEIGTIEQINVTPIRKYQFITGKLVPFWFLGLFELAFGMLLGKLLFDIPMVGSIGLVFLFATVYLLLVLGLGLLVSTFANTQQQSMFLMWFFMVIFILMSGLFTPIESMPRWAQTLTWFNPIAYFVEVIRLVMLKGAGWADIQGSFFKILAFAVVMNVLAVWNYRKRS